MVIKSFKIVGLLVVAMFCFVLNVGAQDLGRDPSQFGDMMNPTGQNQDGLGNNPFESGGDLDEDGNPIIPEEVTDTTKKAKPRKPLESYFFNNTVRGERYVTWNVDPYANNIKINEIDTLLNDFNVDYLFQKDDVGDAYVGVLGGVSLPLNYFRRSYNNDFNFTNAYNAYIFTTENAPFYNVKRIHTILAFSTAGQTRYSEENVSVVHAQNVTPSTGFNITYNNQKTKGIYQHHSAQAKNLSIGVSHTGKRYTVHAGYINNHIYQQENGGIVDDWYITDTILELPGIVPMKMQDALNLTKNNSFYLIQSFGFPLKKLTEEDFTMADRTAFFVGHSFEYNKWTRNYTDTYAGTTYLAETIDPDTGRPQINPDTGNPIVTQTNFYDNWYINPTETRDSLMESVITNRIFAQLQPWDRNAIVGTIDGGVGWDHKQYYQFNLNEYLGGNRGADKKNTFYAYASAQGRYKKYFDWRGGFKLNFAGYRVGDINIDANIKATLFIKEFPIILLGDFSFNSSSPSYWSERYFSNHFAWNNNFGKENETKFGVTLKVPQIGAELGFYQSLLGNKTYYGADYLPAQSGDIVSITGFYAREDLKLGIFHFNHRVLFQHSSAQEVVPVPQLSFNLSYFVQFEAVKNVLQLKIGLDGWYNTKYYAHGYNPATMQFYNQREKEIGGYPYVNVFIVAKWKTVRVILQMQHITDGLFEDHTAAFNVLHYPFNKRVFKIGLSWNFDN